MEYQPNLCAAGLGLRYGGPTPKPALTLAGRPLMSMSIEAMAAGGCTDKQPGGANEAGFRLLLAQAGKDICVFVGPKVTEAAGKGSAQPATEITDGAPVPQPPHSGAVCLEEGTCHEIYWNSEQAETLIDAARQITKNAQEPN